MTFENEVNWISIFKVGREIKSTSTNRFWLNKLDDVALCAIFTIFFLLFLYNFEDFLKGWEQTLLESSLEKNFKKMEEKKWDRNRKKSYIVRQLGLATKLKKKILSVKTEKKYYSEDIYYLVWKILHPTLISNSSSTIHHSSLTGTEALGVMLFFKPKLTSSTKIFGTRSWSSSSASNPERLPLTHTTFLGQSHVCKSWLKVWK